MRFKIKILNALAAFFLTFMMLANGITVQAAEKQAFMPKVDYVNVPKLEYTAGDIVNFNLHSPNYSGRVQYRVVLWDNNSKTEKDLWTTGDRYYSNWMPYGYNNFNLHWRIDEPGSYRITVYIKRAGVKNSRTALKGQNCDNYMESQAFVVKAKATALDKDGETYGSIDRSKIETYKDNINITAKNVTFNNARLDGNLTITGDNAVIRNVNISGKLVVDPGKDGSCTLDNVTAKDITVLSGGKNSIHIKDSNIETMNVNSGSPIRVEVDGDTEIVSTSASGYVIFDRKNGTYGTITITKDEKGESVIEFRGDIKDKIIVGTSATIKTGQDSSIANIVIDTKNNTDIVRLDGQFGKVEISSDVKQQGGQNVKLEVAANTKIENIIANNDAVINLDKTASIANVEKKDNEVIINGEGGAGSNTPPQNDDGEYVPPTVAVSAINVTSAGDATSIVNGDTLQMSAAITPANAANKTITWSVTNGTGSAAINANGLLSATGVGTVTVKAKNPASNVIGSLVITVNAPDKTALTAAINAEYSEGVSRTSMILTGTDYTTESWPIYTDAITTGIAVENNVNATHQQVDNAAAEIATAKGNLEFAGKASLDTAKTVALGKIQADYTTASWTNLTAALSRLETTNTEVVAKTEAINNAISNLEFAGMAGLNIAKTAASGKVQIDYTADSWTAFTNAMATANALEETTNTKVVEKAAAINNAIGLLVEAGDKTALTAAINAEYSYGTARTTMVLTGTDYTTVSWKAYTDAITAAIAVENNANAIQQQVDNAAAAIATAKGNLEFAGKANLDTAKTAASGKIQADYTTASWAELTAALLLKETTNTEVVAKTGAINNAINNLVFAGEASLDTAKTVASGKVQIDYTADSWTAFTSAMITANTLMETTNAEVVEKAAAINTAISKLVFKGKAALDDAKTAASGKMQAEYTAASWTKLVDALTLPETTNAEVVAKATAINNAIGLLVKAGVKTALTAAINTEYSDGAARTTMVLKGTDYTTASWKAYTDAITAAVAVENDANAIQQQVDNAAAAIVTSKGNLVFANKAAMDAAVTAANGKNAVDYTTASWAQFVSARETALALPTTTNADMGARTIALNSAIALLVEKVPEVLNSIEIKNFNYETLYATQARIESKTITTSDFGVNNKRFTITDSSGNVIPVNLTWNIPPKVNDLPATYAAVVGSAVESFIQQYFVDKGGIEGLNNRTLWASGYGDKFSIGAFGPGPTGEITITGDDASYFFDTTHAIGTNEDHSKNRTFTISDGKSPATITLNSSYTNMSNLVNHINSMLGTTQAVAVKIDESHFKLVAKTRLVHLTIEGTNKEDFFSSFESQ